LIAQRLVEARRTGTALSAFPGPTPETLADSYEIQSAAIGLWGEPPAGWKVGRVPDNLLAKLGADRLIGAIFAANIWPAGQGQAVEFPVFAGGFGAVEAEFVYRLGRDAPAGKTDWTPAEALEFASALHIGVEIAGSPIAAINDLGPTVVASDFGNNGGLLLGPAIADWRSRTPESLAARVEIDGHVVGESNAASLPGGPPQALAFALGACASIGWPMQAGMLVSSGAITGVHEIAPGQRASVSFNGIGDISCRAVAAKRYELEQDVSNEKGAAR
jgi:2-keto-4-pentenoate hydratase